MKISNKYLSFTLSEKNGALLSLKNAKGKEFIHKTSSDRPLFTIKFLDKNGKSIEVNSNDAIFSAETIDDNVILDYKKIGNFSLYVTVKINLESNDNLSYWSLSLINETGNIIEWIDFPDVVVPNDLVARGGSSKLFWPAMEGVIIDDINIRDNTFIKYGHVGYPSKGWDGFYPGACPMQFMAYYNKDGGLYLAAHDDKFNVKSIEYHSAEDGIRMEYRLFPGVTDNTVYKYEYDMVLGVFDGDWYDAADIYRSWLETTNIVKLPKILENKKIPQWVKESPIIAVYPVRGIKDTGDMSPNMYYPYTNGTKYIKNLHEKLDTNIMALLCHWEGSAPWAPPYVWPPYGDKNNFDEFADELHENNDLLGVYCSGIAWTNESTLCPEYNKTEQLEKDGLIDVMCAAPDQSVPYSLICNGPIRWGYDMCPANDFVKETAVDEVKKILTQSSVDYIQYFDQNVGGTSYLCYSKKHGHPASPGKWQVNAMRNIFNEINMLIEKTGKEGKVLVGCEAAAAEAYVNELVFNDLRYNINYYCGVPVPAYNYMFHEYVTNFMGNQNTSYHIVDFEKYPDNIFYRFAHSFAQGDILTVVLKDSGKIHWDWCTPWDVVEVDQEGISQFIKHLNDWRKGIMKDAVQYGRMIKPLAIECKTFEQEVKTGGVHHFPSIISTRYLTDNKKDCQILVNYLGKEQTVKIKYNNKIKVFTDSTNNQYEIIDPIDNEITLKVHPRSAILIEV